MFRSLLWLGINEYKDQSNCTHSQAKVLTNALWIPPQSWQMTSSLAFVRSIMKISKTLDGALYSLKHNQSSERNMRHSIGLVAFSTITLYVVGCLQLIC